MDNIKKDIKELDAMFISPKKMRLEELKQLNKSIAYTSTIIQFFWKKTQWLAMSGTNITLSEGRNQGGSED